MIEIFVIYDKRSGRIEGGAGRIDRDWDQANRDGSTTFERIRKILVRNFHYAVIFLPDGDLPDLNVLGVIEGRIVSLPKKENSKKISVQERERKISSEIRSLAIQSLTDRGEL